MKAILMIYMMINGVIIAGQWNMIVSHDVFEVGDFAANALIIERAKEFAAIHGHYSRWGFWHPGPAFFYVYAAAEWLLVDQLGWVTSPNTAHRLGGLLLQSSFMTWGLVIFGKWVRSPVFLWLCAPVCLVYLWHLGYPEPTVLMHIWPPYTLITPYFLMTAAAVSFSCGRDRDIVPFVVAGCFLVHGHVAQPLFVGVTLGCAILLRALREKNFQWFRETISTSHFAIAVFVSVVFAVPLIIDLFQEHSNIRHIVRFVVHGGFGRHGWPDVLRSLEALAILKTDDHWTPDLPLIEGLFTNNIQPFLLLFWGPGIFLAVRAVRQPFDSRWSLFSRHYAFVFAAGMLLLTWWIRNQKGELYLFNNLFAYGLLLMGTVYMVAVVSRWRIWTARNVPVTVVTLLVLFNFAIHLETNKRVSRNTGYRDFVQQESMNREISGVRLVFGHDDWPHATAIALALRRNGIQFVVDREWQFMFGSENALRAHDSREELFVRWVISGTHVRTPTGTTELQTP